ncbi:MAG: ROK family protein, partial [Bdellovibrionales bacterium]|nr:ROK family protein [Bdellovibrionales bacterium]
MKSILGVDLGGTNTKIGIVREDGTLLQSTSIPTLAEESPVSWIDRIQTAIAPWKQSISAIGVGAPGPLEVSTGTILAAPNLPTFMGFAMKAEFEKRFQTTCLVENDANCAALAEMHFGTHKSARDLVVLTLGTGVGSGVVSNGKLVTGVGGFATEIGHMIIDLHHKDQDLFVKGSLESYVGAALSIQRFCQTTGEDPKTTSVESLFLRARQSDPKGLEFLEDWCRALAIGIGNCFLIFNPEILIVSG